MSKKYALIIANTEYTDAGLAKLTAPGRDAKDFARVLQEKDFCGFDEVETILNQPEYVIRRSIDEFFDKKQPDDMLILYFSGHGVRDEMGKLFLAVKDTNRFRLRSTAIQSDFIREAMDQSRSKRQVLILDCCNSGAFAQGTKSATGVSIGTASAFESGYGRIILTASDSTQYAWEGDKVIGETDNSLFTHYLVEGLEGKADRNGDGRITVDELYDYAYEKVRLATPKQTPSKFAAKQQGEIILRENIRMEEIQPLPLPNPLLESLNNPYSDIRVAAVQQLKKIMDGQNLGMARSAKEKLDEIANSDDSISVRDAARQTFSNRKTPLPTPPVPVPAPPKENQRLKLFLQKISETLGKIKLNKKAVSISAISFFVVAILIAFLSLIRVFTFSHPTPSGSTRVSNIALSSSRDDRDSASTFSIGEEVYIHFDINAVSAGTVLQSMWYYKPEPFSGPVYVLISKNSYITAGGNMNIYFFMSSAVLKGTYRVELYMNDQLVGVKHFTVR